MFDMNSIKFESNTSLYECLEHHKEEGIGYCVIYPIGYNEAGELVFTQTGFQSRKSAFDSAMNVSSQGLHVYVMETFDKHVIAYLTGYCCCR